MSGAHVTMAHGGGGLAMRELVDEVFLAAFGRPSTGPLEDQARLDLAALARHGDRLAFTTDSFVVSPLVFPGGDIGTLAVCGTINDLAVGGAVPLFLSCSVILEEGLPLELLHTIVRSMAACARAAGVAIVTGDTKVVERGACDRMFITTSGIGVIRAGLQLGCGRAQPGDVVLVSGTLGDHGATILAARGQLGLDAPLVSDCAPLHELIGALLDAAPHTRLLRDATRGGLAAVLHEVAVASGVEVELREADLPVLPAVQGVCELLGLDPLDLANEGKIAAVVPEAEVEAALAALRAHPHGRAAAAIGRVSAGPGRVVMRSVLGGRRLVDLPVGEPLPRIC